MTSITPETPVKSKTSEKSKTSLKSKTLKAPKKRLTDKERRSINKRNGKKSCGPKTALGRSISSQNALRHGLSVAIAHDQTASEAIDRLAIKIAGGGADDALINLCRQLAEAQLDLIRIRNARRDIWADETLRTVKPTLKLCKALSRLLKLKMDIGGAYEELVSKFLQTDQVVSAFSNRILTAEQGIGLMIGKLNGLERYEKAALIRRNKALQSLSDYNQRSALGIPWP
jgi:hypothetical protein